MRSKNRLESINGKSILPGTNFQGEKLVPATENSVGATVQLRERLYGGLLTNSTYSVEAKAAGTRAEEGTR